MVDQLSFFDGAPPNATARGATISPCGRYRYNLWRTWDTTRPIVTWVMLNPSTADAARDDLTLKKCQGFARQWGYGGVVVVNLFAWRETDPERLFVCAYLGVDIVGPENDQHLHAAFRAAELVVCAWGGHPIARTRLAPVLAMVPEHIACECLGRTASGAPRHPSRLAYATPRKVLADGAARADIEVT